MYRSVYSNNNKGPIKIYSSYSTGGEGFMAVNRPSLRAVVSLCFSDVLVSQVLFVYHLLGSVLVIFVFAHVLLMCYPL